MVEGAGAYESDRHLAVLELRYLVQVWVRRSVIPLNCLKMRSVSNTNGQTHGSSDYVDVAFVSFLAAQDCSHPAFSPLLHIPRNVLSGSSGIQIDKLAPRISLSPMPFFKTRPPMVSGETTPGASPFTHGSLQQLHTVKFGG